jgi:hypothetical protein
MSCDTNTSNRSSSDKHEKARAARRLRYTGLLAFAIAWTSSLTVASAQVGTAGNFVLEPAYVSGQASVSGKNCSLSREKSKTWLQAITCKNPNSAPVEFKSDGQTQATTIEQRVSDAIRSRKLSITTPDSNARRPAILRATAGQVDLNTMKAVCSILGYSEYVSSSDVQPVDGRCNYTSPGDDYLWRFNGTVSGGGSQQCADGIDNDGDGLVDALVEIPASDGKTFTYSPGVDPGVQFSIAIGNMIKAKKLPFTAPGFVNGRAAGIVRSDNANWSNTGSDSPVGTAETQTLTQVCKVLGYRDYVSSSCRDDERSGRYPNGKCNFHSTGDNYMWRFSGGDFRAENSGPKYSKTWITSITCANRVAACSDGLDNDGDGKVDMADDGCASANDTDERPHDPICTSPTSPPEFSQWRDGVSDKNDPGCWKDPTNPNTYDPSLNNEAAATTQCQDTKDNDGDTLIDSKDPGCFTDPKNPATYDRTRNNEALAGPSECMDAKDNDNDGLTDKDDPGCWSKPGDPSSYNPYGGPESSATTQCQDTKDNDGDMLIDAKDPGCFKDPKNPATYDRTRNNEALAGPGECMDGKDNDSDGVTDKEDPGCWTNPGDPSSYNPYGGPESSATTQCQDTKDNDGDTLIDAKDPGCFKDPKDPATYDRTRNNEALAGPGECMDGKDNDNDGVTDKDDPGCWKNPSDPTSYDPFGGPESKATTQCQDTKDNDGDTLIDAKDPGCFKDPKNPATYDRTRNNEALAGPGECMDGKDNDSDGVTDKEDPGCWTNPGDPSSYNPYGGPESSATTQCQDTKDNDGDALIDAADAGCWKDPTNSATYDRTRNNEAAAGTQCSDKIDNDNDNAIDLKDPGCKDANDNDESDEPSLLTIGVECVSDNTDGTKTAYFSYNNTSSVDLTVTTNETEGTLNEFVTTGSKPTPPTTFKTGAAKGTVVATFSADSLTWVVRAPKSALSQASANSLTPRCGKIVPVAECRGYKSGLMQVRFGYTNPNAFPQEIAVGKNNTFAPGAADRGQPNRFFAGKNSSVFEAPLATDSEVVTWDINGSSVTAGTNLPTCDGQCTDTPTGNVTGNLDRIAGELSEIMNRAAQLLESARGNLTRAQVQRNKRDAERAKKKAEQYQARANFYTIEFPAVVKTCPQAPELCVSVDRGVTLDSLRDLYANQRNSVQRTMARSYFRNTNKTNRDDSLVKQAKQLEAEGITELLKLPRVVVECK